MLFSDILRVFDFMIALVLMEIQKKRKIAKCEIVLKHHSRTRRLMLNVEHYYLDSKGIHLFWETSGSKS